MGKRRVIAETGAGQHGVATATACARFGLECDVYMGEEDIRRQQPNVFSMKLLGAEVRPVTSGSRTLRDAINEAMRDWMSSVETTHYILGSVVGPHPFPRIVPRFPVGHRPRDARAMPASSWAACPTWSWPASAAAATRPACSTRSSSDASVELVGVEAGGRRPSPASMPPRSVYGRPGVLHGSYSYVLQDEDGQTLRRALASRPGSTIPASGPEHSYWKDTGRVQLHQLPATTRRWPRSTRWPAAKASCRRWRARTPWPRRWSWPRARPADEAIVVCLSGRGDKDAAEIARLRLSRIVLTGRNLETVDSDARCPTIDQLFATLRSQRRKALMPFVTAGDPDLDFTAAVLGELAARGSSLCELGIPYSDPIADGPVIQASYTRALAHKIKLAQIFEMLAGVTPALAGAGGDDGQLRHRLPARAGAIRRRRRRRPASPARSCPICRSRNRPSWPTSAAAPISA